ncbi:MAG: 30S ribosomal protein S3 [Candidatus Pacearchaeota archaeon]
MIEKKFIDLKKQEFRVREYIKNNYDYVSSIKLERTPIGEKVIIATAKPSLIGRYESIEKLSEVLKEQFGFENPQIEIMRISNLFLDAASVAEYIKKAIEHFGPVSFKVIAYKALEKIKSAGALGAEIRLGGKLPSARAKQWRFSFGYLSKSGEYKKELIDYAKTQAFTKPGIVGIKVAILRPEIKIPDKIEISKSEVKSTKNKENKNENI